MYRRNRDLLSCCMAKLSNRLCARNGRSWFGKWISPSSQPCWLLLRTEACSQGRGYTSDGSCFVLVSSWLIRGIRVGVCLKGKITYQRTPQKDSVKLIMNDMSFKRVEVKMHCVRNECEGIYPRVNCRVALRGGEELERDCGKTEDLGPAK